MLLGVNYEAAEMRTYFTIVKRDRAALGTMHFTLTNDDSDFGHYKTLKGFERLQLPNPRSLMAA